MAKKKGKKATSKKKTARKPLRKPATKGRRSPTRKTSAKRSSRPKRQVASKKVPQAILAPMVFAVDPGLCAISPKTHHVAPVLLGSVQFNASGPCTLEFSDPSILGLSSSTLPLVRGSNGPYDIKVLVGETEFWITDCGRNIPSDPSDIIVP